jgi:FkbM family methyltransferase
LKINFEYNSKILAINKAIHPTASEVTMYKIKPSSLHQYPDWIKGIASLDKNHYLKSKVDRIDIIEELVKAETLNSILDENPSLKDIDYLQIDTEGFDYEVLKMVDFKLLNPKMIKFESVNLNLKEKIASKNLLIKYGYYNFDEFGDTISIDLKRIKIL